MARKAKIIKPRRVYVPVVPANASWFESDSYDRRTWNEIVADAPSLADLAETGERLVPHFGALVQDLFFALFKMNPVFRKSGDVRLAAALNRTILEQIVPSAPFQALRSRTALEEDKAAIAAIVMSEHALEMVKSEKLINRSEMLDLWDLARQEQDLEARAEAVKSVNEIQEPKEGENESGEEKDQATKKELAEMADAAERAAKVSEARLNQKSRQFETQLKGADQTRAQADAAQDRASWPAEIDQAAEDSHDFSREFGQGGRVAAGARLELGRRLARNKKLGELARMVGRFKQDARALKRKTLERGVAEAYDIELGSELGRLIPAELLAMHHPVLKRDFHRRVLEGTVLQYRLRDDEQKGKGPMVVCIDVSSSMQGDKEMWSKAVALTLMDIARRQRRLFRAVMFSSGDVSLKVLDLNRERRYAARPEQGRRDGRVLSRRRHRLRDSDRRGGRTARRKETQARRYRDYHRRRIAGQSGMAGAAARTQGRAGLFYFRGAGRRWLGGDVVAGAVRGSNHVGQAHQRRTRPRHFPARAIMKKSDQKVVLEPIDRNNFRKLFKMHLRTEQITFVTPPRWTLARCYVRLFGDNFEHLPHLIRAGDEVVGYATTACDPNSADNYWIDDIMIAAHHQGKGYGRAAMLEVLKMIVARYPDAKPCS